MPLAELSVTAIDNTPPRLEVAGELDLSTAPMLAARLRAAADTAPRVVVDLHAVSFMDSRGMLALLEAQRTLRSLHGDLILASVSDPVRKVLEITCAWDLFTHERERAVASASSAGGELEPDDLAGVRVDYAPAGGDRPQQL
jgi:anti-sigma B factor antagonist